MMRLQKFLAHAGVASRRKAEELITAGKVTVNGKVITKLGTVVDEQNDVVTYDGKKATVDPDKVYYMLHKPLGFISSASEAQGASVLSLINTTQRLYPVGRLDRESTGLLLLTNDGEFANHVTHARYGLEKEYFVTLDQDLSPEDSKRLEKGIKLDGKKLQPVRVVAAQNKSTRLILHEGVNRQIRRMLGKLGYTVVKLKRIRIGKLELGDLKPGQYRPIAKTDVL